MKKVLLGVAVLLMGLLFYCPETKAQNCILPTYYITDEDVDLLLRVAVLEGGGGDVDGMAHVMQVVLNRFESERFPSTIPGVIFQENQFCTADRLECAEITPEAYVALDAVIFGEYRWNDSVFFESCDGLIWGDKYEHTFSYGGHDFYKLRR